MTKESLKSNLDEILIELCCVTKEELQDDSSLVTDLGLDDLDIVELCIALEERYSKELPELEKFVDDTTTYQQFLDKVFTML